MNSDDSHADALAKARQEPPHIRGTDGDAALRRAIPCPGEVKEDGTAVSAHTRSQIVIKNNYNVIDMVVPVEPLMAIPGGQPNRTIVLPRQAVVAPTILRAYGVQRQMRLGPGSSSRPEYGLDQAEGPARSRVVPFAFRTSNAVLAQRAPDCDVTGLEAPGPLLSEGLVHRQKADLVSRRKRDPGVFTIGAFHRRDILTLGICQPTLSTV